MLIVDSYYSNVYHIVELVKTFQIGKTEVGFFNMNELSSYFSNCEEFNLITK